MSTCASSTSTRPTRRRSTPFHEVYAAAPARPGGEFAAVGSSTRSGPHGRTRTTLRIGSAGSAVGGPARGGHRLDVGSTVDNLDLANVQVCCTPAERATATQPRCSPMSRSRPGRGRTVWSARSPGPTRRARRSRPAGAGVRPPPAASRSALSTCSAGCSSRSPGRRSTRWRPRRRAPRRLHAALVLRAGARRAGRGLGALSAALMTEAPMGEIDREAETADAAAIRERGGAARAAGPGRSSAPPPSTPTGEVVAYTDLRDHPRVRARLPVGHAGPPGSTAATGWGSR